MPAGIKAQEASPNAAPSAAAPELVARDRLSRSRPGPARLREFLPALLFVAALVALWEFLARRYNVPKYLLPRPSQVAGALVEAAGPLFLEHTTWTLMEAGIGLAMAVSAGCAIGVLVHVSRLARRTLYPLLVVSQTVPVIVLAPLLVTWFGYGLFPKLLIVAIACFFPVAVAVVDGLDGADPKKLKLVRAMGAGPLQQFRLVKAPSAMASVFTGLRVAATYGVMAAVVAEWIGSDRGLGMFIARSARSFRTEYVFAGIAAVTAYSIAAFLLIDLLRRLFLPWEKYVTARGGRHGDQGAIRTGRRQAAGRR